MHSLSVQLTRAPLLKCFGALPAFLNVKSQQLEGSLQAVSDGLVDQSVEVTAAAPAGQVGAAAPEPKVVL